MMAAWTTSEPDDPPVDTGWMPHLQALHRYFFEMAADACVLWVDPAQGDPFAGHPLVEARRVRVPIAHPRFDLQFAPYLVPLDLRRSGDAAVFSDSVRIAWQAWQPDHLAAANGQPIAGWIRTGNDAAVVAQHWAQNCHLHVQGGLNKLLRFQDPGVREWLWLALDPAQKRQLLGPATTLVGFSRAQQLQYHELPAAVDSVPASARLSLHPDQWAQVDDYATLHAAWLRVRSAHGAARIDARAILGAMQHATRYNIIDAQDRVLFASHALTLGPEFHADPRLAEVFKLTTQGEFYGGAVEDITGLPADRLEALIGQQQAGAAG